MWHIMLCGLLALPALFELEPPRNVEKHLLTEQPCESCATCAKCVENSGTHEQPNAESDGHQTRSHALPSLGARRFASDRHKLFHRTHRALGWRR